MGKKSWEPERVCGFWPNKFFSEIFAGNILQVCMVFQEDICNLGAFRIFDP
jgi:hypothetical protein